MALAGTKVYKVEYQLNGNANNLAEVLTGLGKLAQNAANSMQKMSYHLKKVFETDQNAIHDALTKSGQNLVNTASDTMQKAARSSSGAYVSTLVKMLEQTSKVPVKVTPELVGDAVTRVREQLGKLPVLTFNVTPQMAINASETIQAQINKFSAFQVKVSPVLAPDSGAILQRQLNANKGLTIDVKANVTGVKTSGANSAGSINNLRYAPGASPFYSSKELDKMESRAAKSALAYQNAEQNGWKLIQARNELVKDLQDYTSKHGESGRGYSSKIKKLDSLDKKISAARQAHQASAQQAQADYFKHQWAANSRYMISGDWRPSDANGRPIWGNTSAPKTPTSAPPPLNPSSVKPIAPVTGPGDINVKANITGNYATAWENLRKSANAVARIQRLYQQGPNLTFDVNITTDNAFTRLEGVIEKMRQVRTEVTKSMAINITTGSGRTQLSQAIKNLKSWVNEVKNLGKTIGTMGVQNPIPVEVKPQPAPNVPPLAIPAEITKIINKVSEIAGAVGVEGIIESIKMATKMAKTVDIVGTLTAVKNAANKVLNVDIVGTVNAIKYAANKMLELDIVGTVTAIRNATNKMLSVDVVGMVDSIKYATNKAFALDITGTVTALKNAANKIQSIEVQGIVNKVTVNSGKVSVEGVLDTKGLDTQIKAFKPKNKISVLANLSFGTGKDGAESQIKALQSSMKPISMEVNLSIEKALEQLNKLKSTAVSMNPLNMSVNMTGTANKGIKGAASSTMVSASKTALTPQNIATAVGRQTGKGDDFYSKTRRATYPFTGNTSFGARSPMALEMAKGMGAMFAVSTVMQTVSNAFTQVSEYENIMKTVNAILKVNDQEANFGGRFKAMENEVRRVGRETKFTAPEVAGAARFMAMAGFGIKDINAATSSVANLALVGDDDMSTAADKMTNIMTSFGLLKGLTSSQKKANMVHASDVLTNTFTKSNTNLMQLAEAMQYAGPMSHLTGTSLEDAAAMVGVMGNAGIQSSMAGTTLRMMYQNIIKPNKKQLAEWNRLGIQRTDENGRVRGIFDILQDLRAKITGTRDLNSKIGADQLKDMGSEVMSLFRTTAGAGTAALLENLGEAMALAQSNKDANGVAQQIADEKKNTIAGLWAQVTSTFTDQSVETVSSLQNTIKDMLRGLRDWLASKEAAETLQNIYSIGSSILDVFNFVAKGWKWILNTFGGALKYFIAFQMFATQVGYLMLPFVQLTGAISSFKNALLGLAGALGATSVAGRGAAGAVASGRVARVAGNVLGTTGVSAAASKSVASSKGLMPFPISGAPVGLVHSHNNLLNKRVIKEKQYQWMTYGVLPAVGNGPVDTDAISTKLKTWERSRSFGTKGFTPSQKRQHFHSIDSQVANLRAQLGSANAFNSMASNISRPMYIGAINPDIVGASAITWQRKFPFMSYKRRVISRQEPEFVMPFHKYAEEKRFYTPNGKVDDSKIYYFAQRHRDLENRLQEGVKNPLLKQKLQEKSDKYYKDYLRAKELVAADKAARFAQLKAERRAAQLENILLLKAAVKRKVGGNAMKDKLNEAIEARSARRHATRTIEMSALARGMGMGGRAHIATGQAFAAALNAGFMAGTFDISKIWLSLKTGLLSLVKGVGMLFSPISMTVFGFGGLAVALYKLIDAYHEHGVELEKLSKSTAKFREEQQKTEGKFNKRASELGGFGTIQVGYTNSAKEEAVGASLENNDVAKSIRDIDNLTASEMLDKWKNPLSQVYSNGFIQQFLQRNPDFTRDLNATPSYGGDWIMQNSRSRNRAKSLILSTIWGNELMQQSWVQQAAEDIQNAVKDNDRKKISEILKAFEVKDNMPRMADMGYKDVFNITNPEKYYEPMKIVRDFLESLASAASPISQAADAIGKIATLSKKKNIKFTDPIFQSLARSAWGSYNLEWNGQNMQMLFDKRGFVDWTTMARKWNEGKAFTTMQKSEILTSSFEVLSKDPNLNKVPNIVELLRTYLPKIANTRFTFSPDDEGEIRPGDTINPNEWKKVVKEWYDKSGQYTGNKSFDKFFSDKVWESPKNINQIKSWWNKQGAGSGASGSGKVNEVAPSTAGDQSEYSNKYNRGIARPTQIIFNMDQLCRFDRTQVASPQEKDVAESVGKQLSVGLYQLFSQAVAEFGIVGQEGAS